MQLGPTPVFPGALPKDVVLSVFRLLPAAVAALVCKQWYVLHRQAVRRVHLKWHGARVAAADRRLPLWGLLRRLRTMTSTYVNLREVDVSGVGVLHDDHMVDLLNAVPAGLAALRVSCCAMLHHAFLPTLATRLQRLRLLDASACTVTWDMALLPATLTDLDVSGPGQRLVNVDGLARLTRLRRLNVWGSQMDTAMPAALSCLSQLQHLHVGPGVACPLLYPYDDVRMRLLEYQSYTVQRHAYSAPPPTPPDPSAQSQLLFQAANAVPTLTSLGLYGVGEGCLTPAVVDQLRLPGLLHLRLVGLCAAYEDEDTAFAALGLGLRFPLVTQLDVLGVTPASAPLVYQGASTMGGPRLQRLLFSTSSGVPYPPPDMFPRTLRSLHLCACWDVAPGQAVPAYHLPHLRDLNLDARHSSYYGSILPTLLRAVASTLQNLTLRRVRDDLPIVLGPWLRGSTTLHSLDIDQCWGSLRQSLPASLQRFVCGTPIVSNVPTPGETESGDGSDGVESEEGEDADGDISPIF